MRTNLDYRLERQCRAKGHRVIVGVDEAGRGPLAGPVVAAAVILPDNYPVEGLNDSKKLTARQRDALYEQLLQSPGLRWAVGVAESAKIDAINILAATHQAMARAVRSLQHEVDFCLIDGRDVPNFPFPQRGVIKGDAISPSIAAASIIAKVTRDRQMLEYHEHYPRYGFDRHKGYGTKQHLEALAQYGPCPIHRYSFQPVAQASLPLER